VAQHHILTSLFLLFDENYSDLRMSEFISHITTNTTEFFRERNHFEKLNKILSEITNKRNNEVRIWCCATSTGQEVYSILISILEFFTQNNIKKEIKTKGYMNVKASQESYTFTPTSTIIVDIVEYTNKNDETNIYFLDSSNRFWKYVSIS
jgi:hypothetical protein